MSTPFDIDRFLAQPLVARVATAGLVVRPVWYLWEADCFWVFTGPWSGLARRLREDPRFDLSVDICDLRTGRVQQVLARGTGLVEPLDALRARRKLVRYLGPDETAWDSRFSLAGDLDARELRWARLVPRRIVARDLSFRPSLPITSATEATRA
ncbi:MAG: pyridoxamine 5'-phosphate oxidase family protein [Pseudonocardiaceae bacterium]